MLFNKNTVLFLLASLVLPQKNDAFQSSGIGVIQTNRNHEIKHQLMGYNNIASARYGSVDDELGDLENARAAFERLMESEEPSFMVEIEQQVSTADKDPYAAPLKKEDYIPILTETYRRRREVEMELLVSLATSDEAIEQLVNYWLVERDQESAEKMKEMEQFCSPGHEREEVFLLNIIDEYGYHWVEPISRLALLYFADERCEECEHWCKVALAVKPWHFEVMQTRIMNAMKQQDKRKARALALEALPPLDDIESRKLWVQRALKDANDAIDRAQHAKKAAIKNAQQKRKTHVSSTYKTAFSDDAWQ